MTGPKYSLHIEQGERQGLIVDRHGNPIINDEGMELIGAPLDGESITKRQLGKLTYGVNMGIGIQQLLHPKIGAAVEYTGKFWGNPYERVGVSIAPIMNVMYAKDSYEAGNHIRMLHEGIYGKDHKGRGFNALDPDAFYWAHNTFQDGVEILAEHYSARPFTDEDREQVQLESTTWYSYYGMPMGMVPADYAANVDYRKHMIDDVLEMNPSAERALTAAVDRNPPRPEVVPKAVWILAKAALMPIGETVGLLTIGELPEDIRHKFDIPFSKADQKHLDHIRTVITALSTPVPDRLKYLTVYDSLMRDRDGRHRNTIDEVLHRGITLGSSALKSTVIPIFNQVRSSKTARTQSVVR
jgi:uncharacterized protein (DUF2236 family)